MGRTGGLAIVVCLATWSCEPQERPAGAVLHTLPLPAPVTQGDVSVESAIAARRSVREYTTESPTLTDVAQLLWAAQGITGPEGRRATPSSGRSYPLTVYVVCGAVADLPPGLYRYAPATHALEQLADGDRRELLVAASGQAWLGSAPCIVAVTAMVERTQQQYGDKAERFVHLEAGAVMENLYLQATARGLGTVMVGGFDDAKVAAALSLAPGEAPLVIMPIGRRP